jgi:PAS domain S-box-containing protein
VTKTESLIGLADDRLRYIAAALDLAFDGLALLDLDLRVKYANTTLCAIGGYNSAEDLIGHDVADLLTTDTMLRVREHLAVVLSGRRATFEGTARGADGQPIPIEVGASVLRAEDGEPYALLAIVRDITERRRAEQALRESEIKYRLLFENLNDAAFLADAETGLILEANKQAETLLGRTRDEIVGMHQTELHPPGQAEKYRHKFERHVQAAGIADHDGEVIRKDGRVVPVTISAAVMQIAGRQLIVGLFRDISDRNKAEQALRASERKYRTLVENLPQKIFLKDRDSVYVSCNDNYARDLGIEAEAIVGMTDYDFYPSELAEKYRADDRRVMESAQPEDIEESYIQDRQERVVQTIKTPLRDDAGNTVGVLGIFWDITQRKRAEQALQAKNRELESFVYTVSHDLRAPLVSLEGFAKLLADEYSERLDAQGHDYLRRLRANVSTMNSLLGDLLELSRVGRAEEPKQAVPVAQIVAEALESLAGMISRSEAHVTVARDLPTVQYSRVRLFQVFANLIGNAIKFSREGVAPQVEIEWESLNSGCRFLVTDNGIGIADGQKHKLFEIFSCLKKKDVEGTGIGLAIVKRIVENHGGQVGVESTPGEGSTFWFTVPLQTPAE